MSGEKEDLEPVDVSRCQAERLEGSFMTFGPRKYIRCNNSPIYIATENIPRDSYGVRGCMSLCEKCVDIMKASLGKDYASVQLILR